MSYFQRDDNGTIKLIADDSCSPKLGCAAYHGSHTKVFWAWDRSLGAWVHYTA